MIPLSAKSLLYSPSVGISYLEEEKHLTACLDKLSLTLVGASSFVVENIGKKIL